MPRKPTNDFTWLNRGSVGCEVKTTGTNYRTIARRIRDAVSKANKAEVTKDIFVIHVENYELPDKVIGQLEKFNQRNPNNRIRELWVLDSSGLRQIELRN